MNMTDYFTDASALLAFALMLYIVVSWGFGQRHTLPLPPGPKGLPILGNFLDMRAARECETLRTWRDTYGELFISGWFQRIVKNLFIRSHRPSEGLWQILHLP